MTIGKRVREEGKVAFVSEGGGKLAKVTGVGVGERDENRRGWALARFHTHYPQKTIYLK